MWRFQACLALYSQENNFERSITETTAERMGILFLWQTKKKEEIDSRWLRIRTPDFFVEF